MNQSLPHINGGSRPLGWDHRDFQHQDYFGAPDPSQLPLGGLGRKVFNLNDQSYTSFCTACNTSEAVAYIKGVEMKFEWQAAKIGFLIGQEILNGADPRKAMQAACTYGALPKSASPMSLATDGIQVADWTKWPDPLDLQAAPNEPSSFFQVDTGSYDAFDNIRTALYQAYMTSQANGDKKQYVVMAFSQWFAQWTGSNLNPDGTYTFTGSPKIVTYVPPKSPFSLVKAIFGRLFPWLFGGEAWHAYLFIDWTVIDGVEYLVTQNSYGTQFGDNGVQYFPREVVNATFADYRAGCYMFRDEDPKTVKGWQERQNTLFDTFPILRTLIGSVTA